MSIKNRILWIDQMRGLAMIWVYFAHIGIPTNYYGLFSYWFIPYFFFLSGYLHNDEISIQKLKVRLIYRILIPYTIYTLLTFSSQLSKTISSDIILNELIQLITGRGIWFFACIAIVEIIAFYISKLISIYPKRRNEIILAIMTISVISMYIVHPRSQIWWHADTAICIMIYYYSGYIFRHLSLNNTRYSIIKYIMLPLLTILSMLIYMYKILDFNISINVFGQPWLSLPIAIAGSITTALFIQNVNLGSIITFIGQNTVWLYGINYYMLSFSDKILNQIGVTHLNSYIYAPIKVITAIILGCLLVIPINQWLPWANGKSRVYISNK